MIEKILNEISENQTKYMKNKNEITIQKTTSQKIEKKTN